MRGSRARRAEGGGSAVDAAEAARHPGHLRPLNLQRVISAAFDAPGSFTRAELVGRTGLSVPTVGSLTAHLTRRGILRDLGTGPSRGGRRPGFLEMNARFGFAAAIDLGPRRTRVVLVNLRGEDIARREVATNTRLRPAPLLERTAGLVRELLAEAAVGEGKLLAVVAAAPGVVDPARGGLVSCAPNLSGWSEVPMGVLLERALRRPVTVENDVNLAVLGERWRGAARGHDTCAFLSVDLGIGAGIILRGELHRGHHSLAGEIGMMCFAPSDVARSAGGLGALEARVGLGALMERTQKRRGGEAVATLFEAAGGGDARARKAVVDAAALVGLAAANLCLVLDPSLLVLGGGMVARSEPFTSEVRRIVKRIVPGEVEVASSTLGEEASLWGAVSVALAEARARVRTEAQDEGRRSVSGRREARVGGGSQS